MDALQIVASATQIVSSMVGALSALEQASRNYSEAPKKIRVLEEFVSDLENLARQAKQKYAYKLHNPKLERQIQSLTGLIDRLHLNMTKARRIFTKSKARNFAKLVWSSMVGDQLSHLIQCIRYDLDWWLELQKLTEDVERVLDSTAENTPSRLRVSAEKGYPVSNKCNYVRKLLEHDSYRVILIVGLSGIGKSCLARQVASDPPSKFMHGAVELRFGQWCSRAACDRSRAEYHKRLAKRLCMFLVQIGFVKKVVDEISGDLEQVSCLLQTALLGKSMLILLDDVWEQDIVDRFTKLYDNECRYLVTTRNEAVYEITEAEKVEICKEDITEISKEILLYHSMLSNEDLPSVGERLLDRCGHHPLTVAVMGKALRQETREEKWDSAIANLSTYATCAPGPVSYVNEKEAENNLTIFGSFEFSLEAMPKDSQRFFTVLAAISWAEPVPEACLEAIWSALGQENMFSLAVCKLVEGSLLIKLDSNFLYHVHDMVSLYLDNKINDAIQSLLNESSPDCAAYVVPWLLVFGKETVQMVAEEKIISFLGGLHERHIITMLETIIHVFMASKSISDLEASRKSFSRMLGPRIADVILAASSSLIVAAAKAITHIFTTEDYCNYLHYLENTGAIDKLTCLLGDCDDPSTQAIISTVVTKLAEYGSIATTNKVLQSIPLDKLAEMLAPSTAEWHESVFATLMSLTKVGRSKAVEMMIASGIDRQLLALAENGSDVDQRNAIILLKTFYEVGGLEQGYLRPGTLNLLPWFARLSLERFVLADRNMLTSPKPQTFEDLLHKILERDDKQVMEAMQELIPIVEKANEPKIREMILKSQLVERLAFFLRHGDAERNRTRSESAFLLMKLACSGGEPLIRKFVELDIVIELVKMMQCNSEELQDSAYTTLHQVIFGKGGALVLNRMLQTGLIEKLTHSLDSKSLKTKELSMLFLIDLVEVGTKCCIERMFSSQIVEKLVSAEKLGGNFTGSIVRFLKALEMSKNLSIAERRVMKQHILRKVKAGVKGHKLEANIVAALEAHVSEGSKGSSSGKHKK